MRWLLLFLLACGSANAQDAGAKCFANLCGMDTGCWCHESGKERRCWSQSDDCEVDRDCCASTRSCKSTPHLAETCGKRTSEARKKRDAAKGR